MVFWISVPNSQFQVSSFKFQIRCYAISYMNTAKTIPLTTGSVSRQLIRLTIPMIIGMLSMVIFNLTDTFFVARLGTQALAAISFTFPIVMILGAIAMGLGTGTASLISRTIGSGEHTHPGRITSSALVLSVLCALIFSIFGLSTMNHAFRILGAHEDMIPLIKEYMVIWYTSLPLLIIPIVGNNAIRGSGDTRAPAFIMAFAAVLNIILDPIFIFGLFGIPEMGIRGAAIATALSRATTLAASLYILSARKRLLAMPNHRVLFSAWRNILHIAIPSSFTNMLVPITIGVLTRLVAEYGEAVVAGVGAGSRITAFALMPVISLQVSMVVFIGQNWGAGHIDRIRLARKYSVSFSLAWGLLSWLMLLVLSHPLANIFSKSPEVQKSLITFLLIVPAGYGFRGITYIADGTFNALNKPYTAGSLLSIRMLVLYIPLAFLGNYLYHVPGIFCGVATANILAGLASWWWMLRVAKSWNRPNDNADTEIS